MSKAPRKQPASASLTNRAEMRANVEGALKPARLPDRPSKQSRVIAMLRLPNGATIGAMTKATGWQQHSVRGFLAGVVRKRLKLKLESQVVEGNRIYRIVDAAAKRSRITKNKTPAA